jgi:hypothetical protein
MEEVLMTTNEENRDSETVGAIATNRLIPVSADFKNMHMAMVAMMSAAAPAPLLIPARTLQWMMNG